MKKLVLGFLSLIAVNAAQAQFTISDTIKATVNPAAINNDIHNELTNNSSSTAVYKWKVVYTDFPANWKSGVGICDNNTCISGVSLNTQYTTFDVPANTKMDFKMQLPGNIDAGSYKLVLNIYDQASGTDKNTTYAISRFPTGISTITKSDDDITVYPNPARGELNVLFKESANIKNIAVYNLIGKPVVVYRVTDNNSAKLNIDNIPSGVYFVRLIDGQGRIAAIRKFTHM